MSTLADTNLAVLFSCTQATQAAAELARKTRQLSEQELAVISLRAQGKSDEDIQKELGLYGPEYVEAMWKQALYVFNLSPGADAKTLQRLILASAELIQTRDPLESLSERERQVFGLLVKGVRAKEIANILALSPKTVHTYKTNLLDKLKINDLATLVKFAIQHDLTNTTIANTAIPVKNSGNLGEPVAES